MRTFDLAIVGYGPTGMTLAALAGAQGWNVVVLERYTGLYNLPRAACFDDEIMRLFQKLGLVDDIMPGAVAQPDYEWVNAAGETLVELSYDDPAAGGWAALYMMYQPHIETVLDRHCRSLASVEIRQGVCVDGLQEREDCVTLRTTDGAGGRVSVDARYVVGADGGSGFVREALGVGVSSYGFEENWLVCDFHKRRDLPDVPTFRQVCDPAQPISIVRIGPNHQRFSFALASDESAEQATNPHAVWKRVAAYLRPRDAELVRVANYVFRSRIADRWRQGRVLLAGDAAHEMPPFLAQGMCSGMRDSHNLAWKLDLVLSGAASADILDSYQPEREPHVRFITEKAIELGRVQTLRDPVAARERDERLLARRRADQAPEKLRYPDLVGGLLTQTPHAGAFFPQGMVRIKTTEGRFDDVVGAGPVVLARSEVTLAELTPSQRAGWERAGGHVATLDGLVDVDGTYTAWFADHGCEAVVVRPDWYLYGTATDAHGLAALLADLRDALGTSKERLGTVA